MRVTALFAALSVFVTTPLVSHASPLVLNPGQDLEIAFTGPSPTCSGGPCDTLQVEYGSLSTAVPQPDFLSASGIFDGSTELGSEASVGISTLFVSALSSFPNPSIQIDFTSIDNGTIDGRIEVTAGAQITFDDPTTIQVILGSDLSGGGGGGLLSVTSVTETPEPGTLALLALGALLVSLAPERGNRHRRSEIASYITVREPSLLRLSTSSAASGITLNTICRFAASTGSSTD